MALPSAVASITSFLDSLSSDQRTALYESPWTCQAVFRSLPPLAKAYVLDLLLIDFSVPQEVIEARCVDMTKYGNAHRAALLKLTSLNVFESCKEKGQDCFRLQPTFQSKLQWALSTGGRLVFNVPAEVVQAAPSPSQLDEWAHGQWEALQMYLLEERSSGPKLPSRVPLDSLDFHRLLVSAGLVTGKRSDRKITDAGFQFLLRDSHRQLWVVLTRYINDASETDLASLISFLMQLGFMRVGHPYALHDLNPREQAIAGHMMLLGLLLPFEVKRVGYYCPTRLATSLCAAGTGADGDGSGRSAANTDIAGGHIIVESNYKVNAYTTSKVQRSILSLFCRCQVSLPNLWVGGLTHESVNKALDAGISAEEMILYLEAHVHPLLCHRRPPLPENVSDQIRLWEAEAQRLRPEGAVYYDTFENLDLYERVLNYAQAKQWVLWVNDTTRAFVAKEEGHESIKTAIKTIKAAAAQGLPIPCLL